MWRPDIYSHLVFCMTDISYLHRVPLDKRRKQIKPTNPVVSNP
jgi:hypothetical protein